LLEITGVVDDAKYSSVRDASPPTIYHPATLEMEKRSLIVGVYAAGFRSGGSGHFLSQQDHS
jgi:hypothetical protein